MFILAVEGKEVEGAYSVRNDDGEQVLYIFELMDDAVRYAMQLEELGFPEMNVMEVEDEIMIKTCEIHDHCYTIITKDDVVIPPHNLEEHDYI
jgi:hypothetical protein